MFQEPRSHPYVVNPRLNVLVLGLNVEQKPLYLKLILRLKNYLS